MIDEPPAMTLERYPASVAWQHIDLPAIELCGPVIISILPGETWCTRCGSDGYLPESNSSNRSAQKTTPTCIRCGSAKLIAASQVLRTDEYRIA